MTSSESEWEDSDEYTSSDTDSEVKHLTFPHRDRRWPVGTPPPKNPVRGTPWNAFEGLRVPGDLQRDGSRYVPGRLPRLKCLVEDEADHTDGGSPAIKAMCLACDKKVGLVSSDESLLSHVESCWIPTSEPPLEINDPRSPLPNLLGHVPCEEDLDCMIFSVRSPGPYGGEYVLMFAVSEEAADLNKLDQAIRKHWMEKVEKCCDHFSMFLMRRSGEVGDTETSSYKSFQENITTCDKSTQMDNSSRGIHNGGEVVWATTQGGGHWPAVIIQEKDSKLLGKMEDPRIRATAYKHSALWHVVFLERGGSRAWVKDYGNMLPFEGVQKLEKDLKKMPDFTRSEKKQWLKAVATATDLNSLGDNEKVLARLELMDLDGGGELMEDTEGNPIPAAGWPSWPDLVWRFCKNPFLNGSPVCQPVVKEPEFSYWPLMGGDQTICNTLLTPDRTDINLEKIFNQPGDVAYYHYHLVPGYTTRCKITYLGRKEVRMRGRVRETLCPTELIRDPEYTRDLERMRKEGKFEEEINQDFKTLIHSPPKSDDCTVLLLSEAPYIPCTVCQQEVAQFAVGGSHHDWRDQEDPERRLNQFTGQYCSTKCARDWISITDIEPTATHHVQLTNSPRFGMCQFLVNSHIRFHTMCIYMLELLRFGPKPVGFVGLFTAGYLDDERADGRHHPLWLKAERRAYRDKKRKWQTRILSRIEHFNLQMPPAVNKSKRFFD